MTRQFCTWITYAGTAILTSVVTGGTLYAQQQDEGRPVSATLPVYTPITGTQRITGYFKDLVNPVSIVGSAASAGIGQWRDRPPEWKQGPAGYGWRYASSFAQHVTQETLRLGASSLLHEDNRYRPSHRTGFGARVEYAVASTFLAYHDDGSRGFSYSNIGSYAGAALISRAWQPASSNSIGGAGVNFAVTVAVNAGLNVVREFVQK